MTIGPYSYPIHPYTYRDNTDDFYKGTTFEQYSLQYYSLHGFVNKEVTLKLIDGNEVSGTLISINLSEAKLKNNDNITVIHLSKISYYSFKETDLTGIK